jgi:hypothetical protein
MLRRYALPSRLLKAPPKTGSISARRGRVARPVFNGKSRGRETDPVTQKHRRPYQIRRDDSTATDESAKEPWAGIELRACYWPTYPVGASVAKMIPSFSVSLSSRAARVMRADLQRCRRRQQSGHGGWDSTVSVTNSMNRRCYRIREWFDVQLSTPNRSR